jgi:hypothetical protein
LHYRASSEAEIENVKRQVDIFTHLRKSLDAQDLASYDKVDVYRQMRKQLHANMRRYSIEGKRDLVTMISESLAA